MAGVSPMASRMLVIFASMNCVACGPFSYRVVTLDRFGRLVVRAWASRVNLSCWQLQHRQAIYKPHWNNGRLVGQSEPVPTDFRRGRSRQVSFPSS